MDSLLAEIEAFISTHGLSQSQFGRLAVNDEHFVADVRDGRRNWPETVARVRLFMATYRAAA